MLFAAPPPPPVSFSRDVAPILAMHCNGCHGEAGGLSTRTFRELMLGGNLGRLIVSGGPDQSLFLQFIDGRRGGQQRMPKDGRPLSSLQVDLIRRWIAEGANNDSLAVKEHRITKTGIAMKSGKITRVFCRVHAAAYLVLTIGDPDTGQVLWSDIASLKSPKDAVDAAEPGELISWDLRAGKSWPQSINLELSIRYTASEPRETELYTKIVDYEP